MPVTRIVTGEWARGREIEVIEAVQSAMLAALKIPDWDRDVTVDTYSETQRIVPTGRSQRFTRVEITMFAGRSIKTQAQPLQDARAESCGARRSGTRDQDCPE